MFLTIVHAVASIRSTELVRLFDDLVRAETRLYNALGERLRAEHGIVTSQLELLRYLRDHPGSRVAEVATNFAAGIGAISKGCDRAEAQGWVVRQPNPADGRSSLITLTATGAALVAEAEATFADHLESLVRPVLTDEQVDAVALALGALRTTLQQQRTGTPAG